MSAPETTCSFCDAKPSFGPYETVHACEACAQRVARLAERSRGEAREIWSTAGSPADVVTNADRTRGGDPDIDEVCVQFERGLERELSADDAGTHLDLAIAYREMALYLLQFTGRPHRHRYLLRVPKRVRLDQFVCDPRARNICPKVDAALVITQITPALR